MSDDAREILRELLAEALAGTNGNGVTPQVPPPPVAAVHRPAMWSGPEVGASGEGRVERVSVAGDDDLNRFAHALLARPQDHEAIRAGRLRFTLGGAGAGRVEGTAPPTGVTRIDRGAVTERTVAAAAKAGGRLVLGPRAVLTPLARDKARALGLEIERESQ
jgi:hypothetical protein